MINNGFMTEDFFLRTPSARTLYHDYAESMPIYDYQCQDCGHVFDALQKMADAPLTELCDEWRAAVEDMRRLQQVAR